MYRGKHRQKRKRMPAALVLTAAAFVAAAVLLTIKFSPFIKSPGKTAIPFDENSVSADITQLSSGEKNAAAGNDFAGIETADDGPVSQEAQDDIFTLSFAGDCTLGTDHTVYGQPGTFVSIVGDNYSYPLQNAADYFKNDDFTLVNLEGALTEYDVPSRKTYRFRGPKEYTAILTEGGVECVSLANNHTADYGAPGYLDTVQALSDAGINYCENRGSVLFITEKGLKIGVYGGFFIYDDDMKKPIEKLREQGADIIICAFHWGDEGSYTPNSSQISLAHRAIDAGADLVYGAHPHVLQPIEEYNGGIICYSLGNFCFGGNRDPADKDSVIIQQKVIRSADGTVSLGDTDIIPFRLSGSLTYNDYCPVPLDEGGSEYGRVLSKLDGSFRNTAPTSGNAE